MTLADNAAANAVLRAQCRCGDLRFTAAAAPLRQMICHCADCRDATGNDYSTTAFFKIADTTLTGATTGRRYVSARGNRTTRDACAACGTMMIDRSDGFANLIGIFVQTISPPFQAAPTLHMWTASRLAHEQNHPDLPDFPRDPGEYPTNKTP
jgi:hypothetical protein